MTTPALRALKHDAPTRQLTLLTSPAGSGVAKFIPEIDEVITYRAPWMKGDGAPACDDSLVIIEDLRRQHFDGAIIFTVYSQNPLPAALVCLLSGIPLRLAHCRENPYHLLTNWVRECEPQTTVRHEVARQLDLVATIGCPAPDDTGLSLLIPPADDAKLYAAAETWGLDWRRPLVVMHPGASAPSRRYAATGFAAVARRLINEDGMQVVITGSAAEEDFIRAVHAATEAPCLVLAGRLDLPALAALITRASLLLSNNTGPVHIAAAVGTPVVDLYALTNPQHAPWQVPCRVLFKDVPCRFCYQSRCPRQHNDCLQLVTPQEIVKAIRELIYSGRFDWYGASTYTSSALVQAFKAARPSHTGKQR